MVNTKPTITVQTNINAIVADCWRYWTTPADIMEWNRPSDDWHTPRVDIDLQTGGKFLFRMETKDGSAGFDHAGTYDQVTPHERIEYTGTDGRKSIIIFIPRGEETILIETFEPETTTPPDIQRDFCQGVLNNFKAYTESQPYAR